MFGSSKEARDG